MVGMKVRFTLRDSPSGEDLGGLLANLVEVYKPVPGLKQKYFIEDPSTGESGGFYLFEDQKALDDYLASRVWQEVVVANSKTMPTIETFIVVASLDEGVML